MYSPAQTTTLLGGWGEREEITADHINCPRSFVPHCSFVVHAILELLGSGCIMEYS